MRTSYSTESRALLLFMVMMAACRSGPQSATGAWKTVDLTHPQETAVPVFPGGAEFQLQPMEQFERGFAMNRFTTGEHTGTHIDAPSHFVQGQKSIDALSLDQLSGPLSVIDLTRKSKADSNAVLTVEDISIAEHKDGPIPPNGFVVIRTGWEERWNDPARYGNADPKGILHFPGVSVEAARFLLKERQVRGIGIDTLSCDPGNSTAFDEHHAVLGAGKVNLENLANLDRVPMRGAWLFAAPLPIKNGTGAPARVFALVPESRPSH